jgi:hypothetical protein
MKKTLLYGLVVLLLTNCTKMHDTLMGNVQVSGQVLDAVSHQPIPQAKVYLYEVEIQPAGLGRHPVRTHIAAIDTTDAAGYYHFEVRASGQYEFEVESEPGNPYYVSSGLSEGLHCRASSLGQHKIDLLCNRSAYVRVKLNNKGKRDTVYAISMGSSVDYIQMNNVYRDTMVYLKVPAGTGTPNTIRFVIDDLKIDRNLQVSPTAWDTVALRLHY